MTEIPHTVLFVKRLRFSSMRTAEGVAILAAAPDIAEG